jgi:hypothetical protein
MRGVRYTAPPIWHTGCVEFWAARKAYTTYPLRQRREVDVRAVDREVLRKVDASCEGGGRVVRHL